MKKQTAVEWLEQELRKPLFLNVRDAFITAKAMEKEQIIEAYREGRTDQHSGIEKFHNRSSAMYYTSTYES
jgi:hypothetical protein